VLSSLLRSTILAAARHDLVGRTVKNAPVSRNVVARYIAGEDIAQAAEAAAGLERDGLTVSLDRLGEDVTDAGQAADTVKAYVRLLERLHDQGLTADGRCEVSVKLTAVGQSIDEPLALDGARTICDAAASAGTTVTLDMEDHTTTDSTLGVLRELRQDFPWTGGVLQSYLRRTEGDCRDLAGPGSRIRLCKGAYREPESVAFQSTQQVDLSYVRCMKVLFAGQGYPMLATHDPRLVAIGAHLAAGRRADSWEYQMLYGIRPTEQLRLAGAGHRVRVYVPYGDEWYGYMMRRMAERPANLTFFLRSLVTRS
jgi:proline dehydrogenase